MSLATLEADLVASARPGCPDVHERLSVYADLLLERDDPLGHAIVAVLRDNDLEVLGIEAFACDNPVEGPRRQELLVCRYRPFARALWLPPHKRAYDTEMVLLPPLGQRTSFLMGAPESESRFHDEAQHEVAIERAFLIGRTTVSQQVYDATGGPRGTYDWEGDELPVHNVSWDDATRWCEMMDVRLPSEAEWEYAARAGTQTPFCCGEQIYPDQVNCGQDPFFIIGQPDKVGRLFTNAFGLFQVHGNVWEWVADHWALYGRTPTDGRPHDDPAAVDRVCRGGSYMDSHERCRSAARQAEEPGVRSEMIGFRVARELQFGPARSRLRRLGPS